MFEQVGNDSYAIQLINSNIHIDSYLNEFAKRINVNEVNIASGFVYKSGLKCLDKVFQSVHDNNGSIQLVVGALKDYFSSSVNNKLVNIDLETAKELNRMIEEQGCKIYTLKNRFYHGKYYLLVGEKMSCALIGSSNLTASGFNGNYELNTLYLMKNESDVFGKLQQWFYDFKNECTELIRLEEVNFSKYSMPVDAFNVGEYIVSVNVETIEQEVQKLSDDDVKFRLNLWLEKNPDNIYKSLDVDNLRNYVAFEYKEYNLIVFESFEASNGYYYFHSENIIEVVQKVRELTKTEIFNISSMKKRGYHMKDKEQLRKKVDDLFHSVR